ncbi:PECTATE LYASE 18-RELATED [Salix koriyanagi]|uniref:PECTATE LYASE 18-RELATED n=1 Tax=Salix koriyanagi TaxID=2511006 RepID=A0A9Q0U5U7_9ROSI|nr:PECTATE LYASE 18-RELATED [Salix koriyanagi]
MLLYMDTAGSSYGFLVYDDEWNEHAVEDPEEVAAMVDDQTQKSQRQMMLERCPVVWTALSGTLDAFSSFYLTGVENSVKRVNDNGSTRNSTERRKLGFFSCVTGNPIDDCWRCDPRWRLHRKRLANCGIGFGRNAVGGRDGRYYVVNNPGDDDPVSPRPGTLRHAVIQDQPLWIVFKRDMVITLKQELIMNSFKTIDARGASVHIANGSLHHHPVRHKRHHPWPPYTRLQEHRQCDGS